MLSCTKSVEAVDNKVTSPTTPNTTENYSEDFLIPVVSAIGPEAQSGTPLSNSIDGSTSTIYHSSWGGLSLPKEFEFTLKEDAQRLDYIYLIPRSDGGDNGAILAGEVWVNTRSNSSFLKMATFEFASGSFKPIMFSQPVVNPFQVKIVVAKTDGTSDKEVNKFISLAEIQCWATNPKKSAFLSLFTDGSCTEVKLGVTRKTIQEIGDTVLRNIGLEVFDKKVNPQRIFECQSYPNPSISSNSNKTNRYGYVDNVTGIYLAPSSDAYIFVGGNPIAPVIARVIDHNQNGLKYKDYPLAAGINKIKPTDPGLLYIVYQSKENSKVKLFFARSYINGYYELDKTDPNSWSKLISNTATSFFDLKGKNTVITFKTDALSSISNSEINEYIKTWDEIVYKQQEYMGLVKYNRLPKNRLYVKADVNPNAYMYATNYFTGYQVGTLSALNSTTKLKTTGVWGPAHEIGHVNQIKPDFTWPGMTEVSNNVSSLYIQTYFEGLSASRIQSENLGNGLTRYQLAFDRFFRNDGHNHYTEGDVFCKLVPFWQLELYFSRVLGYTDFYKDFCEALRKQNSTNGNLHHLEFYKRCCEITSTDLTEFFKAWGFFVPFTSTINDYATYNITVTQSNIDDAIAFVKSKNYPQPAMPLQYIQDNTVPLFQSNTRYSNGSVTVTGATAQFTQCINAVAFIAKNSSGEIVKVYPPSTNSGTYSFEATSGTISSIEAVDATGAITKIY